MGCCSLELELELEMELGPGGDPMVQEVVEGSE